MGTINSATNLAPPRQKLTRGKLPLWPCLARKPVRLIILYLGLSFMLKGIMETDSLPAFSFGVVFQSTSGSGNINNSWTLSLRPWTEAAE